MFRSRRIQPAARPGTGRSFGIATVESDRAGLELKLRSDFNDRLITLPEHYRRLRTGTLQYRPGDRLYFDKTGYEFSVIANLIEGWAHFSHGRIMVSNSSIWLNLRSRKVWHDIKFDLEPAAFILDGDMLHYSAWDPTTAHISTHVPNELQLYRLLLPNMWISNSAQIRCLGFVREKISTSITILYSKPLGDVLWNSGGNRAAKLGARFSFVPIYNKSAIGGPGCRYVASDVSLTSERMQNTPDIMTTATVNAIKQGRTEYVRKNPQRHDSLSEEQPSESNESNQGSSLSLSTRQNSSTNILTNSKGGSLEEHNRASNLTKEIESKPNQETNCCSHSSIDKVVSEPNLSVTPSGNVHELAQACGVVVELKPDSDMEEDNSSSSTSIDQVDSEQNPAATTNISIKGCQDYVDSVVVEPNLDNETNDEDKRENDNSIKEGGSETNPRDTDINNIEAVCQVEGETVGISSYNLDRYFLLEMLKNDKVMEEVVKNSVFHSMLKYMGVCSDIYLADNRLDKLMRCVTCGKRL